MQQESNRFLTPPLPFIALDRGPLKAVASLQLLAASQTQVPAIAPEVALLGAATRVVLGQQDACTLRHAAGAIADADLLRSARRHRMLPILYRAAAQDGEGILAPETMAHLRAACLANSVRNVRLIEELADIHRCLADAGVPAMPFKGPLLAADLYGDASLRSVDDLDLLVRAEHMARAVEAMLAAGYEPQLALDGAQRRAFIRAGWGYAFRTRCPGAWVEVEPGVAPDQFSFRVPPNEIWQHTVRVELQGHAFNTPGPGTLVLLLAAHGAKHRWSRLAWLCDLASMAAAHADIDWQRAALLAERCGGRRILLLGCALAERVVGVEIPRELRPALAADRRVGELRDWVVSHAYGGDPTPPRATQAFLFQARARERVRDRLRHALLILFRPSYSDWQSLPLPPCLFPLYWLTRPVRLALRRLRSAARRQS